MYKKIKNKNSLQKSKGQVLVWFLAFSVTLALVFTGVYSVGQATSEKQKIASATDAAAYSGGLVQARSLNLVAYSNRAVVANEVLIAQMISMQAWIGYFQTATDSYYDILKVIAPVSLPVPLLGAVVNTLTRIIQVTNQVARGIEKSVDGIVPGLITLWETNFRLWYVGLIKPAFVPMVMANSSQNASQAVLNQSVATQGGRHDQPARLVATNALKLINEMEWQRMTHLYQRGSGGSQDERKTAADLILASRDEFSTERPGSNIPVFDAFFGSSDFCAPNIIKIGSEKEGTTKLVNYDRWEAKDTLEFKQKIGPNWCDWGKGTMAEPIGWGRSVADNNKSLGDKYPSSGRAVDRKAYAATKTNSNWSGIKELYDVPRDANGRPSKQEMLYIIAAAKDKSDIPNNEALGMAARELDTPMGSPTLKAGFEKDQVFSMAEARIFFERPQRDNRDVTGRSLFRADGHKEYASLYNPYWQVRLKDVSDSNRALVYGSLGINPGVSIFAQ